MPEDFSLDNLNEALEGNLHHKDYKPTLKEELDPEDHQVQVDAHNQLRKLAELEKKSLGENEPEEKFDSQTDWVETLGHEHLPQELIPTEDESNEGGDAKV